MLYVKALHVVAIISWMAGLLYLPRLFVYHAGVEAGGAQSRLFLIMEQRLLKYIMLPAALVSFFSGFYMVYGLGAWTQGWFIVKFIAVILMLACHIGFIKIHEGFEQGEQARSGTYYKIINEIPTVLMLIIVFMVVLKPF